VYSLVQILSESTMQTFIENLPKAELHVHLGGTLEPELSFALAKKNAVELTYKTPEALVAAYDFHDLPSFLSIYYAGMNVLIDEDDFYQLTYAYLNKARSQETLYSELFFDPQAHTIRGVSFDAVIMGIHKAQVDAEQTLGIKSRLIICFLRDMSAESAMQHLDLAKPYLDWLVGVGLDYDERNNPPIKFSKVFSEVKKMGLKLTMHCDVNQQNSLIHIEQCISDIQIDRIDHGINSLESEVLCELIKDKKIGLTVCPVSNRFVVQSLTSVEVHKMLKKDMLVTINSDDPTYFRAYSNENLIELQKEGNAFKVAWLDDVTQNGYLQQLQRHVSHYT
jgi:adenosine deaminase